ncbi:hypothetical protein ABZT03_40835 [Streptomyces sp. NPDC005574]|uniref:hypothetical protein n=1 Tax=Streptomyces sp. NPDC005574 TaxID=3156891 RepID=UPI0033AA24D3
MAGRTRGGAHTQCPACGHPLLSQSVGQVAAITATVTLHPAEERLPYPQAAARRTPNDLVWCLPRLPYRALRLRWTGPRHPPDCPHQHLTTHKCPPTTLF